MAVLSIGRLLPQRERAIAKAATSSALAQIVGVVVTFTTVPIMIRALSISAYGFYVVLMAIPAILASTDLGIGNGMVSPIARALAVKDRKTARRVVSNGFFMLALSGVAVFGIGELVLPEILPVLVGQAPTNVSQGQAHSVLSMLVLLLAIGIPSSAGARVLLAQQRSWIVGLQSSITSILSLTAVVLVAHLKPSVQGFIAATYGMTVLSQLVLSVAVFTIFARDLRPSPRYTSGKGLAGVLRNGSLFFVLTVAGAVSFQADSLVVNSQLGAAEVVLYSLTSRLYALGPLAASFLLAPLWPAIANAMASGDVDWVRKSFRRSLIVTLSINCVWVIVCGAFGPKLLEVWSSGSISGIPIALSVAISIWTLLNFLTGPLSVMLNSAHVLKAQIVAAVGMSIVNITLSIILTAHIGIAGPIIGSIVSQLVLTVPISLVCVRRILRSVGPNRDEG